jgi:transcriptional regulator with XRE-family HTH domain
MANPQTDKLSDQLTGQIRRAIDESGLTRYRIAKETDIDESALAKIYNGHRALSMEALDRLGEFLNLEIIVRRKPSKAKGR